jgi:choline dehydrogenase-like flavoprotein
MPRLLLQKVVALGGSLTDLGSVHTIVVGAGMAGLTASRRCGEDMVILESGTETDRRHKNTLDGHRGHDLWHRTDTDKTFARHWSTTQEPHFATGSGLRRRVGGRSLYWHGVCLPIEERALRDWPSNVTATLRSSEFDEASYAGVIRLLNTWLKHEGMRFKIGECRGAREAGFLARLGDSGFAAQPVPQVSREEWVDGKLRQVPYTPLAEHLISRRRTLTGYRVVSIVPRGGLLNVKAAGVHGVVEIAARRLVLAAGTIENTRLVGQVRMLLRGATESIYQGLSDHIVQGFVANVPRQELGLSHSDGRAFCYMPALEEAASNLFWEAVPNPDGHSERLAVWAMGEKLPSSSAVVLRTKHADQPAMVTVDDVLQEEDLVVADNQVRLLARVVELLLGVSGDALTTTRDDYVRGRPSWMNAVTAAEAEAAGGAHLKIPRIYPYVYPLGSVDHEAGTLPLGGQLNVDGSLPELPGLTVVGPATFRRSGAANPSLTTLALANRPLADGAG